MPNPAEDRARHTEAIVHSPATKKLIVAGPGTGKTFTFLQALRAAGGRGLALTFINNLVLDLKAELAEFADAFTFHAFCKYLLHKTRVTGLSSHFHYYPPVVHLIAQDMEYLSIPGIDDREIDRCLHNLDDSRGILSEAIRISNYYDTVGHTESVYRMLKHLENNRNEIPTYPLVVVDEYQDFSLLETMFINLLAEENAVLLAGDDDQALYGFKHASANYIRTLANNNDFTKFDLPFCSRCTEVVVEAVNDVINQASSQGLLRERLPKPYHYYPPSKAEDSEHHPKIIYANCTVERGNAPYIGRYVTKRIAEIPEEEIQESREGGYPTALVIGPMQFVRRVYPVLIEQFPNTVLKESSPLEISILDGYKYLYRNPNSRLGWRIVLYIDPFEGIPELIKTIQDTSNELEEMIAPQYKQRHLEIVGLIGRIIIGEALNEEEKALLVTAIGRPFESIEQALIQSNEENDQEVPEPPPERTDLEPSVICTSLLGSKGLSAGRVFIVGFNNGHFPRNHTAITDDEVCSLLVGLSRTRKQCYLVSCGRFGAEELQPSIFLNWIRSRLATEQVDRNWFLKNT